MFSVYRESSAGSPLHTAVVLQSEAREAQAHVATGLIQDGVENQTWREFVGPFPRMRCGGKVSFQEIDLQHYATFDSTPPCVSPLAEAGKCSTGLIAVRISSVISYIGLGNGAKKTIAETC